MASASDSFSNARALVTVVVPTFNRAELVVEAVASIIAQTDPRWELFVVDDGSTDGTVERLEALSEQRLKIIALTHSGNMSRLRNIGAEAGAGKYLAFLDSDDLWLPTRLQSQLRALDGSDEKWSYADVGLVDRDRSPIHMRSGRFSPRSGRIAHDLLLERTGVHLITLLVPRTLFNAVGGFDETLLGQADVDLALRLAATADAVPVAEVLALVREHSNRTTHARIGPHEYAAMVFKKALDRATDAELARIARRRWTEHLTIAGRDRLAARQFAAGFALLLRSLRNGVSLTHWLNSLVSGFRKALAGRR